MRKSARELVKEVLNLYPNSSWEAITEGHMGYFNSEIHFQIWPTIWTEEEVNGKVRYKRKEHKRDDVVVTQLYREPCFIVLSVAELMMELRAPIQQLTLF